MENTEVCLWRIKKVVEVTGFRAPTIYQKVRENKFPRPVKIGKRASAWRSDEIREWVNSRPRA